MEENISRSADSLNCRAESFPFKHLGVLVGASMLSCNNWNPVIETFERRLSLWKAASLSMGGRLVMLKAVLSSLPIYYFSLYRAPKTIIDKLEAIRMRFLWSGSNEKYKVHWVRKENVLKTKEDGGVGICPLDIVNKSLMAKWVWRYKVEGNSLWKGVVYSIHESNRRLSFMPCNKSVSGNWKYAVKNYGDLHKEGIDMRKMMICEKGTWVWNGGKDKVFKPADVRMLLWAGQTADQVGNSVQVQVYKWPKFIPSSISFFAWKLHRNRLSTSDQVFHRKIISRVGLCKMCGNEEENANHLFIGCEVASFVWSAISHWAKIPQIFAFEITDLFEIHKTFRSKNLAKAVDIIIHATCWAIWKERNEATFENKRPSSTFIIKEIKILSFLWFKYRCKMSSLDWNDWCDFTW